MTVPQAVLDSVLATSLVALHDRATLARAAEGMPYRGEARKADLARWLVAFRREVAETLLDAATRARVETDESPGGTVRTVPCPDTLAPGSNAGVCGRGRQHRHYSDGSVETE